MATAVGLSLAENKEMLAKTMTTTTATPSKTTTTMTTVTRTMMATLSEVNAPRGQVFKRNKGKRAATH